jgi:hypothetical protein
MTFIFACTCRCVNLESHGRNPGTPFRQPPSRSLFTTIAATNKSVPIDNAASQPYHLTSKYGNVSIRLTKIEKNRKQLHKNRREPGIGSKHREEPASSGSSRKDPCGTRQAG